MESRGGGWQNDHQVRLRHATNYFLGNAACYGTDLKRGRLMESIKSGRQSVNALGRAVSRGSTGCVKGGPNSILALIMQTLIRQASGWNVNSF